jgi:hypothetical protein
MSIFLSLNSCKSFSPLAPMQSYDNPESPLNFQGLTVKPSDDTENFFKAIDTKVSVEGSNRFEN